MLEPSVCAVILNYGRADLTRACVQSVLNSDYLNIKIIVIDNYSNEFDRSNLLSYFHEVGARDITSHFSQDATCKIYYLLRSDNGGYACGNNSGLKIAFDLMETDFAWILNNDALPDSNALTCIVRKALKLPKCGLIGSTLYYPDGSIQGLGGAKFNKMLGLAFPAKKISDTFNCIIGASVFVSKQMYQAIGGMDERYFLYCEEIDWATRAIRAGFHIDYCGESIVIHDEGATAGSKKCKGGRSMIATYYGARAKILLAKKLWPFYVPSVAIMSIFLIFIKMAKGEISAAKAARQGLIDGICGVTGIKDSIHEKK